MSELEFLKRYWATYAPSEERLASSKPSAQALAGRRVQVEALWLMNEEDTFPGLTACAVIVPPFEEHNDWVWVPSDELVDVSEATEPDPRLVWKRCRR